MTSQAKLEIRRSEATDAKDRAFVDRIVMIVNAAYFWSEAEQWTDEKERTSTPEITDLLKLEIAAGICERTARRRGKNRKNRPGNCGFWDAGDRSEWSTTRCRQSGWLARRKPGPLRKGSAKWRSKIVRAENPNGHRQLLHDLYTD